MSIINKATEFAGLPVVLYHPDVGLVLPTMPRRRFRSGDGKDVWEITLEQDVVVAGAGGHAPKAKASPSPGQARARYRKLILDKARAGYTEEKEAGGTTREALAWALAANPDDAASRMAFADYLADQGEQLPEAYSVDREDYEDHLAPQLQALLADPAVGMLQALVIGCWVTDAASASPDGIIEALIAARGRLLSLRGLFLGDIVLEEAEISWIFLCDLTRLLQAFPKLEHFRSRGGNNLSLSPLEHEHLRSLAFEASNLPCGVVQAVGASTLPALEHLEIWLGTSEYGADTTPAHLAPILEGGRFPALRYLGLRNSEIADDVAEAVARSPLLAQLRVLDLSLGNLTDRGAEALLASPALAKLEKLDIHHHFVSPGVVERLKAVGIQVDAREPNGGRDRRYVAHSE